MKYGRASIGVTFAVTVALSVGCATGGSEPETATSSDDLGGFPGPGCANIVGGAASYDGDAVRAVLNVDVASCAWASYSLHVLEVPSDTIDTTQLTSLGYVTAISDTFAPSDGLEPRELASQTLPGNGSTTLLLEARLPADDASLSVCVYAASTVGEHTFDRAPDEGCFVYTVGSIGEYLWD